MARTGDQGKTLTAVVVRYYPLKYPLSKLNVPSNQETVMSKKILMLCGDYVMTAIHDFEGAQTRLKRSP